MKGLDPIGLGIGGAGVEAGEFEIAGDDGGDVFEDGGVGDEAAEGIAFVDEVGEALRVLFLAKLGAGVDAFGGEYGFELRAEFLQKRRGQEMFQDDEALFVERFAMLLRDHGMIVQLWQIRFHS